MFRILESHIKHTDNSIAIVSVAGEPAPGKFVACQYAIRTEVPTGLYAMYHTVRSKGKVINKDLAAFLFPDLAREREYDASPAGPADRLKELHGKAIDLAADMMQNASLPKYSALITVLKEIRELATANLERTAAL